MKDYLSQPLGVKEDAAATMDCPLLNGIYRNQLIISQIKYSKT